MKAELNMDDTRFVCADARALISPFIDSATSPEENDLFGAHIERCTACASELQSYISLRKMLACIEPSAPPADLVLDTRVKLSHARNRNPFDWLETQLNNVLKPLALRAAFGVTVTLFFFGVLFGSLGSSTNVLAQDFGDRPALYQPSRPTDHTMARFASSSQGLNEQFTIGVDVSAHGRVTDYDIIAGPQSPVWLKEFLSLAEFRPATAFGRRVNSKFIFSFVAVRG